MRAGPKLFLSTSSSFMLKTELSKTSLRAKTARMSPGDLQKEAQKVKNMPSKACWEGTRKASFRGGQHDPNCCNKLEWNHPEIYDLTEQKGDSRGPWQGAGGARDMAGVRGCGRDLHSEGLAF